MSGQDSFEAKILDPVFKSCEQIFNIGFMALFQSLNFLFNCLLIVLKNLNFFLHKPCINIILSNLQTFTYKLQCSHIIVAEFVLNTVKSDFMKMLQVTEKSTNVRACLNISRAHKTPQTSENCGQSSKGEWTSKSPQL